MFHNIKYENYKFYLEVIIEYVNFNFYMKSLIISLSHKVQLY